MAQIKPFRAFRPAKGLEERIAALPYDVYNRQEACEVVKKNPDSFLAIDRAETQFGDDVSTYDERVYEKASAMLKEQIALEKFVQEKTEAFYLYELTMDGRSQTGIVGCASIDDYLNQVIKKHENTRADKELDRIHHVDVCNMQTGPIFLTYHADAFLREMVQIVKQREAVYDFVSDDEIRHRVWVMDDTKEVEQIRKAFDRIQAIYIADGHHRCASAVKVGLKRREEHPDYTGEEEFNYFLSVLFPDEELKILDYNRVVKDLNGYCKEEFLQKIRESFQVEEVGAHAKRPAGKGSFGMYLDKKWYMLTARVNAKNEDPVKCLDVSVLQDYLLDPILGIKDPKSDNRIDFVGGIRGIDELERRVSTDMKVAFLMHPTSIAELLAVADAGLLMPPKSTWFEPKLRSGLFLHDLG